MSNPTRRFAIAGVVMTALALVGCSDDDSNDSSSPPSNDSQNSSTSVGQTEYPLEVVNCGRTLTFDQVPERVVSLAQPQTNMLIALGLKDKITGQAQVSPPDGLPGSGDTATVDAAADIEVLSGDGVPSREITVSAEPDLVVAPTTFEYKGEEGYASMDDLSSVGAESYLATAGCSDRRKARAVADTITDIENFGRIFDVQDRAAALVEEYRSELAEVEQAVSGRPPVKVAELFVFGESIEALAGSSETDVVRAAGGEAVFDGTEPIFGDFIFATVSPEVVAAEQPEAIIFGVDSAADATAAVDFLKRTFPDVPAVKNNLVIPYSATASLPGSLSVVDAIESIAMKLHPDAF